MEMFLWETRCSRSLFVFRTLSTRMNKCFMISQSLESMKFCFTIALSGVLKLRPVINEKLHSCSTFMHFRSVNEVNASTRSSFAIFYRPGNNLCWCLLPQLLSEKRAPLTFMAACRAQHAAVCSKASSNIFIKPKA
jgi:hypothetical protein